MPGYAPITRPSELEWLGGLWVGPGQQQMVSFNKSRAGIHRSMGQGQVACYSVRGGTRRPPAAAMGRIQLSVGQMVFRGIV